MQLTDERRYGTTRWKRVRLSVLRRDAYRCWVDGGPASIADHIMPWYEGMPDSLFFGMDNLRASCKRHNTARGVAQRLERDVDGVPGCR